MMATLNIKHMVQNWLGRKYQQRIFHQAVTRAYVTFAQKYPEWSTSYFDEFFLSQNDAFLLKRVGQGVASATAFALAHSWGQQMTWHNEETRQKLVAELTPIAGEFLRLLEVELRINENIDELVLQPV